MSILKTVEVGFTFVYVDKRRKYTCKDFGLKSIPYGEGDETEADGLPAYQEELEHVKDVLCRTAEKFSLDKDCTRITKMSMSDEWISLYNRDEKDGKLDVEVEVAVNTTLDIQINRLPDKEYNEDGIIYNKVMIILSDLEELSHGRAISRSYSYD